MKCFTISNNMFILETNPDKNGTVQADGRIKWNSGVTSELMFPCGQTFDKKCDVKKEFILNRQGSSYNTRKIKKKVLIENLTLKWVDSKYCFYTSETEKKCGDFDPKTRTFHIDDSYLSGKLQPNGRIVWSNGQTTLYPATDDLCSPYKVKSNILMYVIIGAVVLVLFLAIGMCLMMKGKKGGNLDQVKPVARNESADISQQRQAETAGADNMPLDANLGIDSARGSQVCLVDPMKK